MESQIPPVFYKSADDLLADAQTAAARTRSCLNAITSDVTPNTATFENTILPFVYDENERLWVQQFVEFHQYIDRKDIRDAAEKASNVFQELATEIGMRQDYYSLVAAIKESNTMDGEDKRLLKKVLSDYRKSGLNLSAQGQNRFREIQSKLDELSSKYMQNLSNSKCLITKDELDGRDLELKEIDGKYLVDQPKFSDIMEKEESSDFRRKIYLAYNQKCKPNATLLDQMLSLRHELAQLRGYATSAEYEMSNSDVGSFSQIKDLLGDLQHRIPAQYTKIEKKFSKLKQQDGEEDIKIHPWDRRHYTKKLMDYEFNTEPLWFPVEETVSTMLKVYSDIFAMSFTPTKASTWHEDVKVFEVQDTGSFVGYLYLDLHFRPGRVANNMCLPVRPAFAGKDGKRHYTATALMCSLRKDLMKHEDVIMAFHELGHGIHDLVAKVKYARFHGASTGDFNETPSTMLENWCWNLAVLRLFKGIRGSDRGNDQTSDENNKNGILPDKELQARIVALLRARQLTRFMRQHFWLETTLFDQSLHSGCMDSTALSRQLGNESYWFCNIPHWSHGACNCYCYLMCEVYSADMFETAFARNPMDVEVSLRYKNTVISKGNTVEPVDMVKNFLGRESKADAFYRQLGIDMPNH